MNAMTKHERFILVVVLLAIVVFLSYDVWSDYRAGSPLTHLAVEAGVVMLASMGAFLILSQNSALRKEVQLTQQELSELKSQAIQWKTENQTLIQGLSQAIDRQMQDWQFTPAEKEVALLLLKGLSFKEISTIRESTEKTVRHHAQKIYEKSKLAGRAELSAFFLEDLLQF